MRIVRGFMGSSLSAISIADDRRDTGYKLYGGYQFNRYFAAEGGYFDLGRFGFTAQTLPPGALNGSLRLRGINLDAVGSVPISDNFSAIARIGLDYAEARDSFGGTGALVVLNNSPHKRETNLKAGLGLQYAFNDALGLRLEAERYRVNDGVGGNGNVDLVSLGLIYRFGGMKPVYVARAAAPEPAVYVAAKPQVVEAKPAPLAPAPPPRKITFAADSLFAFDKSILKPEGKAKLDKFAADLKGADFEVITVTGHTDRIGSHEYNMKLSARRASAVKTYLVESAGLPAGKITAAGKDGADPVTKAGQCAGAKSAKVIACLQPDRRVDVEVTATKAAR